MKNQALIVLGLSLFTLIACDKNKSAQEQELDGVRAALGTCRLQDPLEIGGEARFNRAANTLVFTPPLRHNANPLLPGAMLFLTVNEQNFLSYSIAGIGGVITLSSGRAAPGEAWTTKSGTVGSVRYFHTEVTVAADASRNHAIFALMDGPRLTALAIKLPPSAAGGARTAGPTTLHCLTSARSLPR